MKKHTLVIMLLVVATALFVAYTQFVQPALQNRTDASPVPMQVMNEDIGLTFSYQSGPGALAVVEPPVPEGAPLRAVYLLMNNEDYNDYFNDDASGTAPATFSVFAFDFVDPSTEEQSVGRVAKLQTWASQNAPFSSWNSKVSESEVVELDGVTAIRYQTDSAYQQEVTIALYSGVIYVFTAQYESAEEGVQQLYRDIYDTVLFD